MTLVWKLLRAHISKAQITGFFIANLIGTTIVLAGIQFTADIRPLFSSEDTFMGKEYLIVSKQITTLGSLTGKNNTFTSENIAELNAQPFTKKIGTFTPSHFQVVAGVNVRQLGGGLSTEMFFESVPDEYIDVDLSQWQFDTTSANIPIILPRNYLNLYNFGFAQSQGLPKLSEGIIGKVGLDIHISGNQETQQFKGKIIGFSNRLNTILVPCQFMEWANRKFSENREIEPSRLIIEVKNPADERITQYFRNKSYEAEDGKLDTGRVAWFLKLIIGLVMLIGTIICALSFYTLILSIYLLLQKNITKLENLLLIGYTVKQTARPYQWLTLGLNGAVLLFSIPAVLLLRKQYTGILYQLWPDFHQATIGPLLLTALSLFLLVTLFNLIAIRHKIGLLAHKK